MTVLLVFNPYSGSFSKERLFTIARLARENGLTVIERPAVATPEGITVDFPSDPIDALWVFGGDGTLNVAVGALLAAGRQDVPVLFIPGGTSNVLGHEFGVLGPARFLSPVEIMRTSRVKNLDVGLVRFRSPSAIAASRAIERVFLMSCGTGFDSVVADCVHSGLKARFGRLAYLLSVCRTMLSVRPLPLLRVTLPDGTRREGRWFLAANASRYAAGIRITEGVPSDGVMECFLFRLDSVFAFLRTAISLVRRRPDPGACFYLRRGEKIIVQGAADLQVDGDYELAEGDLEISFHPAVTRMYIPGAG